MARRPLADQPLSSRAPRWLAAAAAALSLSAGLLALAALWEAGRLGRRPSGPVGYLTQMCVGVMNGRANPIGIWWISPHLADLPPRATWRVVCADVPWAPYLPQRGRLLWRR